MWKHGAATLDYSSTHQIDVQVGYCTKINRKSLYFPESQQTNLVMSDHFNYNFGAAT